jgi:signal peptidase I
MAALFELRRAALAVLGGLLLWSVLPVLFGCTVTVVVSGSMVPTLRPGDVVVVSPVRAGDVGKLTPGKVILAADPAHPGQLLTHRLVGFTSDGNLITKGDANEVRDGRPVPPSGVRGVARLRVPLIGTPKVWIRDRKFAPMLALGVLVMALLTPRRRRGQVGAARVE